jgi:single-stranded DNA-binding protein
MVNHADKEQPAFFIPVSFFGATALHVMKCIKPGNIVSVNGYIQMVKVKLTSFNGEPRIRDRLKVVVIAIGNIINSKNLKYTDSYHKLKDKVPWQDKTT